MQAQFRNLQIQNDYAPVNISSITVTEMHLLEQIQIPSNYKTRLCMMHASGTRPCNMGSRCKFAHGLNELRQAEVVKDRYPNNKYKTKLCKNFARGGSGFCNYGLRCEFVHPTDREYNTIPPYRRLLCNQEVACEKDASPEDHVVARHEPRVLWCRDFFMMFLSMFEPLEPSGDISAQDISNDQRPPHLRRRRANP